MIPVRFSRSREEWVVGGRSSGHIGVDGELLLAHEQLAEVSASELRRALTVNASFYSAAKAVALVSAFPVGHLGEDSPIESTRFELADNELVVLVRIFMPWPEDGDEDTAIRRLERLAAPLLSAGRRTLQAIDVNDWYSSPVELALDLRFVAPPRGRSAADLFGLGEQVRRLCAASVAGTVTRQTVADLVRGGEASLLVGQPEGNWLEVKSQEYDLDELGGQISLAHAVARFCNGEDGGLIIVGASTKRIPGGELIRAVSGVSVAAGTAARYQRTLDRLLYPPPLGMRINVVPTTGRLSLVLIDIPPQGEELKPFLVQGAIRVDGVTEGAFISVVQRRGEGSIPLTAPMIHSMLAAGRALLRNGRLPEAGKFPPDPSM